MRPKRFLMGKTRRSSRIRADSTLGYSGASPSAVMEDQVNASHPPFPRTLLASAFALAAFAPAPALGHGPQTCDTHTRATSGIASDPEEGGQVTAAKDDGSVGAPAGRTGYDLKANAKARTGGGSSDPEEGGELTSA